MKHPRAKATRGPPARQANAERPWSVGADRAFCAQVYTLRMGMVEVRMVIANPQSPDRRGEVTLLADTGATYSVVPRRILEQIGIVPIKRAEFEIAVAAKGASLDGADGRNIQRDLGQANFIWNGEERFSVVIFGEESDAAVLGVVTLESLGLQVDPVGKQLRPAKLILY